MNEKPITEKPWTDLGYMNGWNEPYPEAYRQCREAHHFVRGGNIGNCLWQTWCDTCRITWKVDSSD